MIPIGKNDIETEITRAINEILDMIVHKIGEGEVIVCGAGDSRRMLGRKLEDRLGQEVVYE
jgi:ribulose 1,5-bisphosphate synthetase/thiazole synthase